MLNILYCAHTCNLHYSKINFIGLILLQNSMKFPVIIAIHTSRFYSRSFRKHQRVSRVDFLQGTRSFLFRHAPSLVRVSRIDFLQDACSFPNKEVSRFSTEKSTTSRFFTPLILLFCAVILA